MTRNAAVATIILALVATAVVAILSLPRLGGETVNPSENPEVKETATRLCTWLAASNPSEEAANRRVVAWARSLDRSRNMPETYQTHTRAAIILEATKACPAELARFDSP